MKVKKIKNKKVDMTLCNKIKIFVLSEGFYYRLLKPISSVSKKVSLYYPAKGLHFFKLTVKFNEKEYREEDGGEEI